MDNQLNKQKSFGEILDSTFRLSKNHFVPFFMIYLILIGPVYLLQALIEFSTGTSFFREVGTGSGWFEQILSSFADPETSLDDNFGAELGEGLASFITFFLYPVASAAILIGVDHIRKNATFTVGSIIKQGFSRFWPIIGSTILFSLMIFGIIIVLILIIIIPGFFMIDANPIGAILFFILIGLALAIMICYLSTRWSFFLGSVVLDKETPGFSRSWMLTKGRTWTLMGLYIIFYLIVFSISLAIEFSFGALLGNSVLLGLIVSLTTLFTSLILSVGFAVMFLDLKVRHDADDLKDMIDDYNGN